MSKVFSLLAIFLFCLSTGARADDVSLFQGKWMGKRPASADQPASTGIIEFKNNKVKFEVQIDGSTVMAAEAEFELKDLGFLKIAKLTKLKVGSGFSDLSPLDDDRTLVYMFQDGKLYLAGNMDKERPNEKPALDIYTKISK